MATPGTRTVFETGEKEAGQSGRHYQAEYLTSGVAVGAIPFGRAIGKTAVIGDNNRPPRVALLGPDTQVDALTVGTGNAGLTFTAKKEETWIRVSFTDPSGNNQTLAVNLTGTGKETDPWVIDVLVATDGGGAITSTPNLIITEITGSVAEVDDIVALTLPGDGDTVVIAAAEAPLVHSTGGPFHGLALFHSQASNLDTREYADKDQVLVCEAGIFWVVADGAIDLEKDVWIRVVDNGLKLRGMFTDDPIAGETVKVTGLAWISSRADAGIVELEVKPGDHVSTITP